MKRFPLVMAIAASAALPSGSANAATYCAPSAYVDDQGNIVVDPDGTKWACVYTSGGYWCHRETGPNGNWIEYCVGATGVRQCWETYPEPVECSYLPGPIT